MHTQSEAGSKSSTDSVSLLYEVSRVIATNHYRDDILLMVVQLTAQLTGSKICSMMLMNEAKDKLEIRATQCLSEAYRTKPPIRVGQSISGRAVLSKKPIAVLDISQDKDYQYPEIAKAEGVCSLAAVPMIAKDHVIGVLNCYTSEPHVFSEEELKILSGVANQAAMAVENTQLLAEKIQMFEQLEARKSVDNAKRILMKQQGISEDAAHKLLQKQSMNKRKTLKEIAEAIILSAEIIRPN
ncbi:MAG: GAF domain-containing protein [Candidatus Omnitrophota bacterium]|nr:GAF domain-containing protein [Candidatus Omnitrophota bacterium]